MSFQGGASLSRAAALLLEGPAPVERVLFDDGMKAELEVLARRAYPHEACAVLLGRRVGNRARVIAVVSSPNLHPDPRSGFELDPSVVVGAARLGRARNLELLGFFHTHPDRPPEASAADTRLAWNGFLSVIMGVAQGRPGGVRAYLAHAGALRSLGGS